ncbi:type I-E CRISPR-associated protein Cse2/CasB [Kineothrix sp. MB12-C1]|uniref:type I-E CRISPR-associated protein Cse2/CasB n=1 Tax=Kineothrix sp. MB12-C1 TaxID=3070215 RepID=UPI0027D316C9|nr:type I-E CRISPR-associated protein Cse2/CasB [Kineothrix sp. MB12-C1]WMC93083.1 type I-E CRISPR-associated protein Cse2/CasB [Kineothrix sp. MB12-C1]
MSEGLYKVTERILCKLGERLELSETRAALSRLRNSIGRDISETVEIWPLVFEEVPVEYLSKNGIPTHEENAIVTSLQLYALHQQGRSDSVHKASKNSIGKALHTIRDMDNTALDRRFNSLITSGNFKELTTHLRHLISILKQEADTKIDYAKLAEDFYWYQSSPESANRMRMCWGQDYYFYQVKEKEGEKDAE